jgi:hypothetical protein
MDRAMITSTTPSMLQSMKAAMDAALALNADEATIEDGWKYVVEAAGRYARIAVYDETGYRLGYL